MSNNLMFYNIPEADDENCLTSIANNMKDIMKLENSDQIRILEALRLGDKGQKIRPVLAKFHSLEDRERIRKNSKLLNGSAFGMSEQLPVELQNRRKTLLPTLKDLRDREVKAYFARDNIFVDGREDTQLAK